MRHLVLVSFVLFAAPATAAAQSGHARVLVLSGGSLPARFRAPVSGLIAARSVLVSSEAYRRAAEHRGLQPARPSTVRTVGTQQGADVIALVTYRRQRRHQSLRVRFFHGRSGELITTGTYRLRGRRLRPASQHALLRDLAAAAVSRVASPTVATEALDRPMSRRPAPDPEVAEPEVAEPEVVEPEVVEPEVVEPEVVEPEVVEPEPEETVPGPAESPEPEGDHARDETSPLGLGIACGIGVGQRASFIPMEGAEASLSSTAYPTIQLEAVGHLWPEPESRFRLELSARYSASVGLSVQDRLSDGNTRTSDLRVHHLVLGLSARIPLASGTPATMFLVGIGGAFNVLEADVDLSIPDYALAGAFLRAGFSFPIGDSPLSITLVPEIGHAVSLSEELTLRGRVFQGFSVGGEGVVRLQIIEELAISVAYRESHSFLGSEYGADMTDSVRYGTIRIEYEHR